MTRFLRIGIAALVALASTIVAAQPITYQGQLQEVDGPYNDGPIGMEFRLYESPAGTNQVGSTVIKSAVEVTDGLFQVQLDFGHAWTGADRYLEIMVAGQTLSPRQQITPVPLAISAINDSDTTYAAGSGLQLSGTTFTLDTAVTDNRYWNQGGDTGTNPGSDFLGTLDAVPFEIRTAGSRHLRIEPSAQTDSGEPITANLIGGSSANHVTAGVRGATIAGGGVPSGDTDPDMMDESPNRIDSHYATIGGGYANKAGDQASVIEGRFATVGGGARNIAVGLVSTIGGGDSNTASFRYTTVGGGNSNTAGGYGSTVAGGMFNTASFSSSSVGGGHDNTASGHYSTVAGGSSNTASGHQSTVAGGYQNCAGGVASLAAGNGAKVRPGSNSGAAGNGCNAIAMSGDSDGDEGTFVWADSQWSDFVSTGANQFLIRAQNGVGINTNDPNGQALRVNGTVQIDSLGAGSATDLCLNASGVVSDCSASSVRYKEDVVALKAATELVERLRAVSFQWKDSGRADIGLIAEEVAEVEPRLATYDNEGRVRGVKYRHLSAVLIAAFQEQQGELEARKSRTSNRLAALEAENADLKARLTSQEAAMARHQEALSERLAALEAVLHGDAEVANSRD